MALKETITEYFTKQKDTVCVYLFGSTAAGKAHRSSDVDIAVLFGRDVPREEYSGRAILIADELSRQLDKNIDVAVLNSAGSFMKFQVIKNGIRIYEHKERRNREFEARTIAEYFDFLPIRRKMEGALIKHIKEGA